MSDDYQADWRKAYEDASQGKLPDPSKHDSLGYRDGHKHGSTPPGGKKE